MESATNAFRNILNEQMAMCVRAKVHIFASVCMDQPFQLRIS